MRQSFWILPSFRPIIWFLFPHLTSLGHSPAFIHTSLSQDGSRSEGFHEEQDSLWSGILLDFWPTRSLASHVWCLPCPKRCGSGDPFILYSNEVLPLFVLAMIFTLTTDITITLRCFQETKIGYLPFQLLLPFWRANRKLIINSPTGAHLSLVSGNANRRPVVNV